MFKIGDIVRFKFLPTKTAMVCGFGLGSAFAYHFGFQRDEEIVLAMRENGAVIVFRNSNEDYEIVDHVDMSKIFTKIVGAKE